MNPREALKKISRLPAGAQVELFLYPIFMLWQMPIAWTKAMWAARMLLNGQWDRFMGFSTHNAINCLFYRTQWINVSRHGRLNRSPILGLGNYDLKNWFHLSQPASFIFAKAGAVTTLVGVLTWGFSHLVWLQTSEWWWVVLITLVTLFSTISFSMAFARQNYQILGWMWCPLALYATIESQTALAGFAWFCAAIFGITPIFFAVPLVPLIALQNSDASAVLVLVPAVLYIGIRFVPLALAGSLGDSLNTMAKLIGARRSKVRYDRGMRRYGMVNWYFTGLYGASALLLWIASGQMPSLAVLGVLLYVINQRILRVADEESLYMIVSSIFASSALVAQPSVGIFAATLLALNPLGYFLSIQSFEKGHGLGPFFEFKPFDHSQLRSDVARFLSSVPSGERVIFSFDDPNGQYANLFDGYRVIHELPLCVAAEKGIHLMPDWYAVAETNYEGSPEIWGRTVDQVHSNCNRWGANFAIIYQEGNSDLDQKWLPLFQELDQLDWGDKDRLSSLGQHFWTGRKQPPKWFVLRLKK
jgi:hypothetical protein